MRCTVMNGTPNCAASLRVLQWVRTVRSHEKLSVRGDRRRDARARRRHEPRIAATGQRGDHCVVHSVAAAKRDGVREKLLPDLRHADGSRCDAGAARAVVGLRLTILAALAVTNPAASAAAAQ